MRSSIEDRDRAIRSTTPAPGAGELPESLQPLLCFQQAQLTLKVFSRNNHQGLSNELIEGPGRSDPVGRIRRRPRLGGLLNYYARAA